ncbi:GNAT family N-acetyltransferase [Galbibacter sp. EGI 63066]|uniref:GNAT family N-acetyltransferase n=1 Tax=Galbibacter sp. EGI 63066 TaxID=2993559 RepID=UPI00224991EC|nr:GNAT family N-acetyltransferase [Galbibacter sp. EGI 63066]MCX2681604.1 GNAT family N-acetyltransferase [Galbibacter sp. EGI 63066]
MEIRFARESDITQLVALCALHAAFEKADFNLKNKAELLKKHLFDKQNLVKCLVIETEGELMGYATFMKQFSTWDAGFHVYLDCLYLKESIRGQGIGSQLMKKIKDYAASENCGHIQWQTPDFNEKAIAFYQKLGAVSKTKERFFWDVE